MEAQRHTEKNYISWDTASRVGGLALSVVLTSRSAAAPASLLAAKMGQGRRRVPGRRTPTNCRCGARLRGEVVLYLRAVGRRTRPHRSYGDSENRIYRVRNISRGFIFAESLMKQRIHANFSDSLHENGFTLGVCRIRRPDNPPLLKACLSSARDSLGTVQWDSTVPRTLTETC